MNSINNDVMYIARENFERARREAEGFRFPDAGGRWEIYCSNARYVIANLATAQDAIAHAQLKAGFETRQTGEALVGFVDYMQQLMDDALPEFAGRFKTFAESEWSAAHTLYERDGRKVSAPLAYHAFLIMRGLSFCTPHTVVEIGGGTGGPARAWMTNGIHNPSLYIDVDFAESLFYAEVFLRVALPDVPIVYWHRGVKLPRDGKYIVLCPISNIDQALDVEADLVMNSGSMQEMSDAFVSFYMDAFDRSKWRRFYSMNYFGQPIEMRNESMNFAAPVMSPNWCTVFKRMLPGNNDIGTAEQFFERGPQPARRDIVKRFLEKPPVTHDDLLDLFDAVRAESDSDMVIEAAAAATLEMPFLPKEAFYLARKAQSTRPSGRALLRLLEPLAAAGDLHKSQSDDVDGTINGSTLSVGGRDYTIVDGFAGAVEYVLPLEDGIDTAGWAGDVARNRPATAIVACHDGKVVNSTVPIGDRGDIQAGYGLGITPAKFSLRVRTGSPDAPVSLFALTEDLRAARLSLPDAQPAPQTQPPIPKETAIDDAKVRAAEVQASPQRRRSFWRW